MISKWVAGPPSPPPSRPCSSYSSWGSNKPLGQECRPSKQWLNLLNYNLSPMKYIFNLFIYLRSKEKKLLSPVFFSKCLGLVRPEHEPGTASGLPGVAGP